MADSGCMAGNGTGAVTGIWARHRASAVAGLWAGLGAAAVAGIRARVGARAVTSIGAGNGASAGTGIWAGSKHPQSSTNGWTSTNSRKVLDCFYAKGVLVSGMMLMGQNGFKRR